MNGYRKILFATDLSPASEPAFREAITLAQQAGAELLIAHSYEPPTVLPMEGNVAPWVYDEWNAKIALDVEKGLEPLVERAKTEGVRAKGLVLRGVAAEAVTDAAAANDADLLVLGTHGRKGVPRFFLGSVAAQVIASAPCPVLTVRAAA